MSLPSYLNPSAFHWTAFMDSNVISCRLSLIFSPRFPRLQSKNHLPKAKKKISNIFWNEMVATIMINKFRCFKIFAFVFLCFVEPFGCPYHARNIGSGFYEIDKAECTLRFCLDQINARHNDDTVSLFVQCSVRSQVSACFRIRRRKCVLFIRLDSFT